MIEDISLKDNALLGKGLETTDRSMEGDARIARDLMVLAKVFMRLSKNEGPPPIEYLSDVMIDKTRITVSWDSILRIPADAVFSGRGNISGVLVESIANVVRPFLSHFDHDLYKTSNFFSHP